MKKSTIQFWLLLIVSVALSVIAISLFVKALKLVFYLILVLALTPVFYIILRLLIPSKKKPDDDELTKRY